MVSVGINGFGSQPFLWEFKVFAEPQDSKGWNKLIVAKIWYIMQQGIQGKWTWGRSQINTVYFPRTCKGALYCQTKAKSTAPTASQGQEFYVPRLSFPSCMLQIWEEREGAKERTWGESAEIKSVWFALAASIKQGYQQLILRLKKKVWFWLTQLSHGPQYSGISH